MKNFGAILFLSVFIAHMLSPVFPYIEYVLNKKYIAEVLCINKDKPESHCHGKCHLNKQIKKQAKANNDESPVKLPKQNTSHIDYFVEAGDALKVFRKVLKTSFNYIKIYRYIEYIAIFHPPG